MGTRQFGTLRRVEARGAMRCWLGRMPWVFGWLLVLGTAFGAPPSTDQIRCWIRQLGSNDFAICTEASRKLGDAGDAAIESLLVSASKADAEVAWRATGVLEQIAVHGNEKTLRRVTEGLEALTRRGKPGIDGIVGQLQARQARLQRERAVVAIRSLGGRFEGEEKTPVSPATKAFAASRGNESGLEPPPDVPDAQSTSTVEPSEAAGVGFIGDAYISPEFFNGTENREPELVLTIGEQWRGGDAGLAALLDLGSIVTLRFHEAPLTDAALEQLAALPQLRSVEVEGCHFSAEALNALRQRQPRMRIIIDGK
jgi:hypothetical protein